MNRLLTRKITLWKIAICLIAFLLIYGARLFCGIGDAAYEGYMQAKYPDQSINDVKQQAEDHFREALTDLKDAIIYSMETGLEITVPPIALDKMYKAVEAWKSAAESYNNYAHIQYDLGHLNHQDYNSSNETGTYKRD